MEEYLLYLACYGAFVIFVILAQVLAAAQQVGLSTLAGNREGLVLTGLAGRMERAANNSLLSLALVAPAVGMVHAAGNATGLANQLVLTFLVARIFYVALYAFGIIWLRTAAWLAAFLCAALLYLQLLL
ncbi:MAPEG family protein [Octadecabacter sp.]|nr:MAPEG family protein [Octadecabacter sp.]